jgi:Icc-related predicted phosphoesterase
MTINSISINGRSNGQPKRPVRIAGASGGFSDRQRAISSLAKLNVDVIVGDWLSECTMTLHGAQKVDNERLRAQGKLLEEPAGLFDPTFIENLSPALHDIQRKGIKVAVNAGACDTKLLAVEVRAEVERLGLDLKVAYVDGDEVTETVQRLIKEGEKFISLMDGIELKDWGYTPIYAQ